MQAAEISGERHLNWHKPLILAVSRLLRYNPVVKFYIVSDRDLALARLICLRRKKLLH